MSNAIHVIQPYRHASTWVFDDPDVGLHKEPFVSGIPEMIDTLVANVPNALQGFRLLFSADPFPGYQVDLVKVREEYQGVWYRWVGRDVQGGFVRRSSAISIGRRRGSMHELNHSN